MKQMEAYREFLHDLEKRGELVRIRAEVDANLELSAITARVCKGTDGGKALFFERIRGSRFGLLSNLFGSASRVGYALGATPKALADRLRGALLEQTGEASLRLKNLLGHRDWQPVDSDSASWSSHREDTAPDLQQVPAIKSWPGDGGRYLTLPLVFTTDADTGAANCGMYRMQIVDSTTGALSWRPTSDAARHHESWRRRRQDMPVAIALGADPTLIYAAGTPLPPGCDETSFAGFLRGRPLQMAACLHSSLRVPACAEMVLEGVVSWNEEVMEGPFGNHTGFYNPKGLVPKFRLTAVTHREDPRVPCTLVGPPPMEDCCLARVTETLFLPLLQLHVPEIRDLHYFNEGIFHGCAALAVEGADAMQGKELMEKLWATDLLRRSRVLIFFDADVDIRNSSETLWRAFNLVQASRDLLVSAERLGIDARKKHSLAPLVPDEDIQRMVRWRWKEYGL